MKKMLSILLAFLLLLAMLPPVSVAAVTIDANKKSPLNHAINTTISPIWSHSNFPGGGDRVQYYYKFTMPEDGYAVFDLQYTGNVQESSAIYFALDAPGDHHAYIGVGDNATAQVKALLQAGEYVYHLAGDEVGSNYPETSRSCQVTWHYQLSKNDASYTHTATDKEPNDSWSTGISLAPNTMAYGMIGAPDPKQSMVFDSYDIYKFSLSSRSEVTLECMGIDGSCHVWIAGKDDDSYHADFLNSGTAGNSATKLYTLGSGDYRIVVNYNLSNGVPTPYQLKYTVKSLSGGGTSAAPSGNMSDWAVEEIKKAEEMGLIPDSLLGPSVDYTKSITRAEFAGIAVRTYESLAHTTALPSPSNPFYDTTDLDVLKAYHCGVMVGVSDSSFEPYTLLDREQAATALTRVFKRATMDGWTFETDAYFPLSYARPSSFADDADISSWAKDSVYFMVSNGIINGVGDNRFEPRAVTSAQEASGYATATREQALAIAVRMVENLG